MMPGQFTAQCCCCKVSWLVFQKWRACMGWLCLSLHFTNYPCSQKACITLTRICSLWSSNCQSTYSIRTLYGSFEKEISMPSWSSSYHQQQTTAYCSISMDDYCNHSTQYCWSGGDTCRLFCIWSYSSLGTGGSWCAGWGRLDSGRGLWSRWRSKKEEAYRRVIGIQKLIIQLYWSWLPMDQIQMNDNKWLTMVSVRNHSTWK